MFWADLDDNHSLTIVNDESSLTIVNKERRREEKDLKGISICFFFCCALVLREKTAICAIIRKSHFAQNCPIPLFRNSSFAQFRNFVIIICGVFLGIERFFASI